MKSGISIVELAQELLAQQESKRDFHAPTSSLSMLGNGNFHLETNNGSEEMPATDYAHAQMASRIRFRNHTTIGCAPKAPISCLPMSIIGWVKSMKPR
jgi:hypothetical protein